MTELIRMLGLAVHAARCEGLLDREETKMVNDFIANLEPLKLALQTLESHGQDTLSSCEWHAIENFIQAP